MDYALIGKIEKAKIYAEEKDRIQFESLTVNISGDHSEHHVQYANGDWTCDCDFFHSRHYCSHTMAMERILGTMIPATAS
jgi:hypothetical protein